eukprot:TRINITY_DN114035_c0_g1_i1.p1 TRINITY_DN114035_c0_g1~~TRINITY_DN114035_c0_g1_i1.p1  ORF type:complete len:310 (+),score=68.81 TRINITY_DN114035_c0_g1_i1:56-931(+)
MVRQGAFSAIAAAQERAAREELSILRGNFQKEADITCNDRELRDEAGFLLDDNEAIQYVSREDAERKDGIEFEVVHKRVAIRKRPDPKGHVLGALEKGEHVTLFDIDSSKTWRKLHFRLPGGKQRLVEAWVMLRHEELGTLLRRLDGLCDKDVLPSDSGSLDDGIDPVVSRTEMAATQAAAAGLRLYLLSSAQLQEDEDPTIFDDIQCFEVVRKPFTAVRSKPGTDGEIVTTAEFGEFVETFGWDCSSSWRKVFCRAGLNVEEAKAHSGKPVVAWMLVEHPEVGPLLRHQS